MAIKSTINFKGYVGEAYSKINTMHQNYNDNITEIDVAVYFNEEIRRADVDSYIRIDRYSFVSIIEGIANGYISLATLGAFVNAEPLLANNIVAKEVVEDNGNE